MTETVQKARKIVQKMKVVKKMSDSETFISSGLFLRAEAGCLLEIQL